jgi:hypothetical protein
LDGKNQIDFMADNRLRRQLVFLMHSNTDLFSVISSGKAKIEEIEEVWEGILLECRDGSTNLVQALRIIYETLFLTLRKIEGRDFEKDRREKALGKEVSYEEASILLDCSVTTIKRLVKQGSLNANRYNRKNVKLTVSEVERFRSSIPIKKNNSLGTDTEIIIGGEREFREELNSILSPKTISRATLYNYTETAGIRKSVYTTNDLDVMVKFIKNLKAIKRVRPSQPGSPK